MTKWIIRLALLVSLGFCCSTANASENSIEALRAIEPNLEALNEKISRFLLKERFYEIENYLDDLNTRRPMNLGGVPILEGIYENIGGRRSHGPYLEKWVETRHHHSAYIARGIRYAQQAWRARGQDWGYTVSQKHSDLYRQKLKQAAVDFEKAYRLNNHDPNSAAQMVRVCIGLAWPKNDMEQWFTRAVTADPLAYLPYFYKLEYLSPKWHGSVEEHTRFVQECYSNPPAGSIAYTLVLDYSFDYARRSGDMKAFLSQPQVVETLEEVISRWQNDYPRSQSLVAWQAEIEKYLENYEKALDLLNQGIVKNPNATGLRKQRGDIYFFNLNKPEMARADYIKVLEKQPTDSDIIFNLGKILHLHDDFYEKAIEYYDKAIALNPRHKAYFCYRGMANMRLVDYREAVSDFSQAIRIDAKFKEAYLKRGKALYQLGQLHQAVADFNYAISLDPKTAEAYYFRGYSHAYLGDESMAREDFLAAREYNPDYANSVESNLKDLESNQKFWQTLDKRSRPRPRPGKSLQQVNRTIPGKHPKLSKAEMLLYEGLKYFRKKRFEKAKEPFEKLLVIEPQNHVALCHLGYIAFNTEKNYQKALDYGNKALEIDSEYAKSYTLRGQIFDQMRQYDTAATEYEKALFLDSNETTALSALAWIYWDKLVDFEKAFEYFDNLVRLGPNFLPYYEKRAMCKFNLKDYRAAIDGFDMLLKIAPKSCSAYYYRGQSHAYLSNKDLAMKDFLAARECNPKYNESVALNLKELENNPERWMRTAQPSTSGHRSDTPLMPGNNIRPGEQPPKLDNAKSLLDESLKYFHGGHIEEAKLSFEKLIAIEPQNHVAIYHLGYIAFAFENDYKRALDYCEKAIEIDPEHAEYYALRGKIFNREGQYDTAIQEYEKALSVDGNEKSVLHELARIYRYQLKDLEKAMVHYDKLVRLTPDNKIFLLEAAMCRFYLEDYRAAIVRFDVLINMFSKSCKAYYFRGQSHAYLGHKSMAMKDFLAAKECAPAYADRVKRHLKELENGPEHGMKAANKSTSSRRPSVSIEPANKTIPAKQPKLSKAESLQVVGLKYFRGGNIKDAKGSFEKLLAIEPQNHAALYHLAYIAYVREKNYQKALNYSDQAIKIDSEHAESYTLRGKIFQKLERYDTAALEYEKALSMNGVDVSALENLARIYRSKLKDFEKAFKCYDRLARLEPNNKRFLLERALCKYYQKDYQAALDGFNLLLQVDPENCNALFFEGIIYWKLRQKQDAINRFQIVVKNCNQKSTVAKKYLQRLQAD